eukprot:m.137922 g.137922  ORF g.137922 m.137922 type:complete len:296 (-) comp29959_c0_seq1:94-981(-)
MAFRKVLSQSGCICATRVQCVSRSLLPVYRRSMATVVRSQRPPEFAKHIRGGVPESKLGTGWGLLTVPAFCFGLGVWQVQRKAEKELLIEALSSRLSAEPIKLPHSVDEVQLLDYRKVSVSGEFEHEKEILLGPRTLLREAFDGNAGDPGMHVITPFVRSDNGDRILVNRGWVPLDQMDPKTRLEGQTKGNVSINCIVSNPSPFKINMFVPENNPKTGEWFWLDLETISTILKTKPIIVEAAADATPAIGFPTAGQSKVTIRNEHMQYIATWFGLSLATTAMWFTKYRPDRLFRR